MDHEQILSTVPKEISVFLDFDQVPVREYINSPNIDFIKVYALSDSFDFYYHKKIVQKIIDKFYISEMQASLVLALYTAEIFQK
jgi:hypothetical protein